MTYFYNTPRQPPPRPKRKCFISYHHRDQRDVDQFIKVFDHALDGFTARGLGQEMSDEIIRSTDTDYVMGQIRRLYVKGSSVTLVMIGCQTWSRRYVDWEIQSSLRQGQTIEPNGLLGIKLPSHGGEDYPERLNMNLLNARDKATGKDCYARVIEYPSSAQALADAIEAAYQRRATHARLIVNPRERFTNNRSVRPAA